MMQRNPDRSLLRVIRRCGIVLLSFWLLAPLVHAQPVILHLRNGDRIAGTIINEDTNRVVISTTWIKELTIPVAEIERRETPPAETVKSSPEKEPAPAPEPPKVEARKPEQPAKAEAKAVAKTAAKSPSKPAEQPAEKKWFDKWKGEIQLGVDLQFGERDREIYYTRLKTTYTDTFGDLNIRKFRQIFDYSFTYGETDEVVSADRMDGSSKTDFDVGKEVFVYNLIGAGYDNVRRIDLRYEVGPGVGYHLITRSNFVMNTELGVNYQVQDRADGTRNENFYFRLAEDLTWNINTKLTLDEKLEFFPRVEDPEEYRIRFESTLRILLSKNLFLNFTVLDLYDTQPARNVSRNDLQIRSSISYKF